MAQDFVTGFSAVLPTLLPQVVVFKKRIDINNKVRFFKGRMQVAYKKIIEIDPTADGYIIVRLKIASDGRALDALIQ